jgi:hypothetical protein
MDEAQQREKLQQIVREAGLSPADVDKALGWELGRAGMMLFGDGTIDLDATRSILGCVLARMSSPPPLLPELEEGEEATLQERFDAMELVAAHQSQIVRSLLGCFELQQMLIDQAMEWIQGMELASEEPVN